MASEIRAALNEYFPATCGVRVIAEPGTFYVATAFTLVANVIGKRWITPGEYIFKLSSIMFMVDIH